MCDAKPDRIRCWNITACNSTSNLTLGRPCNNDELPNDKLFHYALPITISSIIFVTIPAGFVISRLYRKKNMKKLSDRMNTVIENITTKAKMLFNLIDCSKCKDCAKKTDIPVDSIEDNSRELSDGENDEALDVNVNEEELKQDDAITIKKEEDM